MAKKDKDKKEVEEVEEVVAPEVEKVQDTIDEGIPYGTVQDPENVFPYCYTQGDKYYDIQLKQVDERGKPVYVERKMRECPFCQDEYFMTPKEIQTHIREDHPGGV